VAEGGKIAYCCFNGWPSACRLCIGKHRQWSCALSTLSWTQRLASMYLRKGLVLDHLSCGDSCFGSVSLCHILTGPSSQGKGLTCLLLLIQSICTSIIFSLAAVSVMNGFEWLVTCPYTSATAGNWLLVSMLAARPVIANGEL